MLGRLTPAGRIEQRGTENDAVRREVYEEIGVHQILWNASVLPSSVYLYRLEALKFQAVKKMFLVKQRKKVDAQFTVPDLICYN